MESISCFPLALKSLFNSIPSPLVGGEAPSGGIKVEDPAIGGGEGEYICRSDRPKGYPTQLAYVEKTFDMNHPIDRDPESCRRVDPETSRGEDSKPLKLLETLIDKIIKRLEDNSCQPKIRDALKAIQLRQKAVETSEAEKIFWQEIDAIRRSELSKLYPEPTSLEAQIQETILGLKDLVKNGILPLKTVTDAFNQARSKQGRLTYRRMARLLSAMGFTRAKTPNGCSAIIWDDELLPQDTSSDAHDSSRQER